MAKPVLADPRFFSEEAAFDYVEGQLWPEGPVCPHCGSTADKIGRLAGVRSKPSKKNPEGVVQIGLRKCYACRGPAFTVRKGTIFEDSHLPLRMWLQAIHLLCASKKGISTRQLQRMLGSGMKTAWHLGHRIREMMNPDKSGPVGGKGKTVEADDMELGRSIKTKRPPRSQRPKNIRVLSLVERGGPVRSMVIDHRGIGGLFYSHFDRESRLVTDSAPVFKYQAADHEAVDHSKYEWARGDVHTNTLEGFFSIFKRGIIGVYQHIDAKHFDRYLAEFDFRMNTRAKLGINDVQREAIAVKGAPGKRLTYQTTGQV
jgi:ISXO2 transposase-like protein/transposase-like zinc ribbon protein